MMTLKEWEEKVSLCIKCGSCQSICPVYLETRQETLVARGKMALLAGYFSDALPADKKFYELLSNCLLCGACSENCPSGVKADDLIQQGRSLLIEKVGAAKGKRILAKDLLPFPDRLKTLRQGQNLLFKKIPKDRGLKLRFSSNSKTWPALAQPFFLDRKDIPIQTDQIPALNIGYFVGCTTNYLYPEIGEATMKLVSPLGKVILPAGQTCCGLPAFGLGDTQTARDLARKNVLAFSEEGLDSIVVACSSCASHIKLEYPHLLADDAALMPKVLDFVQRTEELSQFLSKRSFPSPQPSPTRGEGEINTSSPLRGEDRGGGEFFRNEKGIHLSRTPEPEPQTVAFHDPCHAKRKLKIFSEPRRLLSSVSGLTLVELEDHRCCGHGGLFSLSHPDLSQKILDHPLGDLDRSRAEVITTSCMACLMQFKTGVQRTKRKIEVKHWAELMV